MVTPLILATSVAVCWHNHEVLKVVTALEGGKNGASDSSRRRSSGILATTVCWASVFNALAVMPNIAEGRTRIHCSSSVADPKKQYRWTQRFVSFRLPRRSKTIAVGVLPRLWMTRVLSVEAAKGTI